jgi:hypothetical protein
MLIRVTRAMRHYGNRCCCSSCTLMQRVKHIVKSLKQRLIALRIVDNVGQKQNPDTSA